MHMNKKWMILLLVITLLCSMVPGQALADVITASAPDVTATSYIVIDGKYRRGSVRQKLSAAVRSQPASQKL